MSVFDDSQCDVPQNATDHVAQKESPRSECPHDQMRALLRLEGFSLYPHMTKRSSVGLPSLRILILFIRTQPNHFLIPSHCIVRIVTCVHITTSHKAQLLRDSTLVLSFYFPPFILILLVHSCSLSLLERKLV